VPYLLKTGDILTIGPFKLLFDQVQVGTPIETGAAVSTAAGEEEIALAAEEAGAEQEIEEPVAAGEAAPPVPPPPAPQEYQPEGPGDGLERLVPPGLSLYSRQLLRYLPGIYNTDFMSRFLALFESIQIPIQWNVDNFDLFLDPGTSPYGFLPWLAHWFEVVFDDSWSENQRRAFLKDAHLIYSRHGTRWALGHVLEIYTGFVPDIVDIGQNLAPHTFMIQFPFPEAHRRADLLGRIIDEHKPAHTSYTMKFKG
jgi:phage tail-like protein